MSETTHVLVADDEPNLRRVLAAQLRRHGYEVTTAGDGEEALSVFSERVPDVVISDLRMPRVDGMALLRKVCESYPRVPVIMITAHGTVDTAVEALKAGAFDYITKPFDRDELRTVVDKAAKTSALSQVNADTTPGRPDAGRYGLVGSSDAMGEVYAIIERVADTPSTVLITGESGTGKELVARALHEQSSRREKPFIKVNVAAIPTELIESELFGHEKGAFTGAMASKPGRFELADGGTLFLDEIGEIPIKMQVKLLRALQEQEFERVGGIRTTQVDVRVVAATNRDLDEEISAGRFREDLYYRLNVVRVPLPPLRERGQDIPMLAEHFLAHFNQRLGRDVQGFSEEAMRLLQCSPWRGNIRELENVVERCMLFCDGAEIGADALPPELRDCAPVASVELPEVRALDAETGLKDVVKDATAKLERGLIEGALEQTGGNVTHAAKLLKISRKSLQMKMKEFGLRE